MKTRLLLAAPQKRILIAGSIKKYVVAGEQKAIVNMVAPDADKQSQDYARKVYNGMLAKFASNKY